MATSLLALLDDIASVLDDIAVLTKVSTQKAAGILGDDLALNAQQVSGVAGNRELPVVWAVAKGSLRNKAILVPLALLLSVFAAWAISPLLMLGGGFLCYEGAEKLMHWLRQGGNTNMNEDAHEIALVMLLADPSVDVLELEREKVRGAIRTDFVLSAEIIAITLGTVASAMLPVRIGALTSVAVIMTAGVYGLVAAIVKFDDLGLHLQQRASEYARAVGRAIVIAAPWLMKALSVAGTLAMFLVGGGILGHGLMPVRRAGEILAARAGVLGWLVPIAFSLLLGVMLGTAVLAAVSGLKRLRRKLA